SLPGFSILEERCSSPSHQRGSCPTPQRCSEMDRRESRDRVCRRLLLCPGCWSDTRTTREADTRPQAGAGWTRSATGHELEGAPRPSVSFPKQSLVSGRLSGGACIPAQALDGDGHALSKGTGAWRAQTNRKPIGENEDLDGPRRGVCDKSD